MSEEGGDTHRTCKDRPHLLWGCSVLQLSERQPTWAEKLLMEYFNPCPCSPSPSQASRLSPKLTQLNIPSSKLGVSRSGNLPRPSALPLCWPPVQEWLQEARQWVKPGTAFPGVTLVLWLEESWQIPGRTTPNVDSTPGQGCQAPWAAYLLHGSNWGASSISGRETQPRGAGRDEVTLRAPNTGVFVADSLGEGKLPSFRPSTERDPAASPDPWDFSGGSRTGLRQRAGVLQCPLPRLLYTPPTPPGPKPQAPGLSGHNGPQPK